MSWYKIVAEDKVTVYLVKSGL